MDVFSYLLAKKSSGGGQDTPTPKNVAELNEAMEAAQNYGEYLASIPTTYSTYTSNSVTLYTPNINYKVYCIHKRESGKYRIAWFNSHGGLTGLMITGSNGVATCYFKENSGTSMYFNANNFVIDFTLENYIEKFYHSSEYNTLEECIAALQSNSTTYSEYSNGAAGYVADTPYMFPYSNTFIFENTDGDLSTTKRVSQNETIQVIS